MATPCTGIDWPATVQAVGSVLALLLTGGLAWWETRQRRRDDAKRAGEQLEARVAVVAQAAKVLRLYLESQSPENKRKWISPQTRIAGLQFIMKPAKLLQYGDMPTPACVEALFIAHSALETIDEILVAAGDQWLHAAEVQRLDERLAKLDDSIKKFGQEVERLKR